MYLAERILQVLVWSVYTAFVLWGYVAAFLGWAVVADWIMDYQTLLSGMLALSGAALGAWYLSRQTSQIDRHEFERQLRRREAARAVLPLGLSAIIRYSVDAAEATKLLLDQCVGENLPERPNLALPVLPAFPVDAIALLRDMVETVAVSEVPALADLVADLQVQTSRLSESIAKAGDTERIMAKHNLEEYIIDCAIIYAGASNLLKFARRMVASVPQHFSWGEVHSALFFFGLLDAKYDRIRETMLRRANGDLTHIVASRWRAREF